MSPRGCLQVLTEYEELYAEALAMRALPKWEQWNKQGHCNKAVLLAGGTLDGLMLTTEVGRQIYLSVDHMKGVKTIQVTLHHVPAARRPLIQLVWCQSKGPYDGLESWAVTSPRLVECAAAGKGFGYSYPSYNGGVLLRGSFVLTGRLAWIAKEVSYSALASQQPPGCRLLGLVG